MLTMVLRLVKGCRELRQELVTKEHFGDPITLEFSGREVSAITYALGVAYLTELLDGREGYRKVTEMISEASEKILATHAEVSVDSLIDEILSKAEKTNPEEAGDGA